MSSKYDHELGMHRVCAGAAIRVRTQRATQCVTGSFGAPPLLARQPFGNITIANTASGADDSTELAIDMAARAVNELRLI